MEGSLSPRRNTLLALLPNASYERLSSRLEFAEYAAGTVMHEPGKMARHVYFPVDGVMSRLAVTQEGKSSALALLGSEGMLGSGVLTGSRAYATSAVVLATTRGFRVAATIARNLFQSDTQIQSLALRYAHVLLLQVIQTALCNKHHTLEQQLCRWLLMYVDHVDDTHVKITHDLIARMLGVRRAGVSETAGRLQQAGLIRCDRADIQVLSRSQLEAKACECYATDNANYSRLISHYPIGSVGYVARSRPD